MCSILMLRHNVPSFIILGLCVILLHDWFKGYVWYVLHLNNGIVKMEVGCLRHPGASTIGSQLLDE